MDTFISYSHRDAGALDRLHAHLAVLRRDRLISAWFDREIDAGNEFSRDIERQLARCELFLLLVSPDFLNSDYCYDIEMTQAMARHKAGEARVVPIVIEPCDWRKSPLGILKPLPRDGIPVSEWPNANNAYLDVVSELRRILVSSGASKMEPRADAQSLPDPPAISGTKSVGKRSRPATAAAALLAVVACAGIPLWWLQSHRVETPASYPPTGAVSGMPSAASTAGQESRTAPAPPTAIAASSDSTSSVDEMVDKVRASLPGRTLSVAVALDPPRASFAEGELLSIGFSTKEEAYVLVFVYSQDRSVTMLYPNDYAEGRKVLPDAVNWVGGNRKFVIKVVPPFGVDTIHVVAFRHLADLKQVLETINVDKITEDIFKVDRASLERSISTVRLRGLAVEQYDGTPPREREPGWGDAVATIVTRARPR